MQYLISTRPHLLNPIPIQIRTEYPILILPNIILVALQTLRDEPPLLLNHLTRLSDLLEHILPNPLNPPHLPPIHLIHKIHKRLVMPEQPHLKRLTIRQVIPQQLNPIVVSLALLINLQQLSQDLRVDAPRLVAHQARLPQPHLVNLEVLGMGDFEVGGTVGL